MLRKNRPIVVYPYMNSNKFIPTLRELKGLEADAIRSKHNLSFDIHASKALIEENGLLQGK
jgi:hypothetical protein